MSGIKAVHTSQSSKRNSKASSSESEAASAGQDLDILSTIL
jgi:hypothetical protein